VAPIVSKLFEWYATGQYALKEVAQKARDVGFIYRRTGANVPVSAVHSILRNRLYTGQFEWNGKLFQGRHQPLVSVELWERVQSVLDGRNAKKAKRGKHNFAFSGLIVCGKCGCSVVGELKKHRYVYYHCTGYTDKCQGNPTYCRRKYVREEVLEQKFADLLGRLQFDDEVLEWVRKSLHASHADERREHEEARRLLNFILSNCSWEDGEVVATFRQPFDLLAQTTAIATRTTTSSDSNSAKSKVWLGN
jgi:site-specific DNA recombinase